MRVRGSVPGCNPTLELFLGALNSGYHKANIIDNLQANPLNTYLSSKPSFTSPQPLAAASGLTIPLQITLSEIKLSAFIILVFSKQKGLTLVFRNDPLESLKVSSTFDSIQFVRDYLQRTIELKLRDLMMEELPAIIHRLSLRLWCPDQVPKEDDEVKEDDNEPAMNPLATPPLDPVDAHGHLLDPTEISSLSLDGSPEMQSLFSQKNLHKLASLTNSHLTSSLANPVVEEAMFRACAGPSDKLDAANTPLLSSPSPVRSASYQGSSHTYTFSDGGSQRDGALPSRPSMVSLNSATAGLSLGSGRHAKAGRKKKTRVVNLRCKTGSEASSETGDSTLESVSVQGTESEPAIPNSIREEPGDELFMPTTPPVPGKVRFRPSGDPSQSPTRSEADFGSPHPTDAAVPQQELGNAPVTPTRSSQETVQQAQTTGKQPQQHIFSDSKMPRRHSRPLSETSSVILEQAWIAKMASEIARRVYEEENRNPAFWEGREEDAPPAYEAN